MNVEELEQRVRTLEIRMMVHSRVILMLAWYTALEIRSGSPLTTVAGTLKGLTHKDLKTSDEQEVFLQYQDNAAVGLANLGKSIEAMVRARRMADQKLEDAELKEKIEEILDSTHFEVFPVKTVTEE